MAVLVPAGNATSALTEGDTNALGVSRNDRNFAAKTNATLALADWNRYKTQYQPLEDILLSMSSDPAGRENAMEDAQEQAQVGLDNAGASFERQARGLGLQLTEGQRASYQRKQDITGGLTRVGAANTAARNYDDLRRIILGGM